MSTGATLDHVVARGASARFATLVVLGDWLAPRAETFWLGGLLELLTAAGFPPRTGRTAVQRMAADGWFTVERRGRRSLYTLTDFGRRELAHGDLRVFESPPPPWEGSWHLVTYSLPDRARVERDGLRKALVWLGFGQLHPGMWICPHDRRDELAATVHDLNVTSFVTMFRRAQLDGEPNDIVARAWDLTGIDASYRRFLRSWKRRITTWEHAQLSSRDAFVARFRLHHDFLSILRHDPNLPVELLPAGWNGTEARQLFARARQLSAGAAGAHVRGVWGAANATM
jgi:phenylacetic acid degradation operon negative regulatory protein